jgi:murein L,D-transpeptidase YafK
MRRAVYIIAFLLLFVSTATSQESFKAMQMRNPRVRQAYAQKEQVVKKIFSAKGLAYPPQNIFFRILKREGLLELWAADSPEGKMLLVKEYHICAASGGPGPKRKRGDLQVPEGFYRINHFNPVSNFYLSLGIDYPNRSDRILGHRRDPGSAIYIHGDCVTIGCIPITDEGIKELYLTALEAKANGQRQIPVHIFPCRMDSSSFSSLLSGYGNDRQLQSFWNNLKQGYDLFEINQLVPAVQVDRTGKYIFTPK